MTRKAAPFLSSAIVACMTSLTLACGSGSSKVQPPQAPDVYVAGFEAGDTVPEIAEYWKNGTAVALGTDTCGSDATSIFVSGPDVYVAGNVCGTTRQVAQYWKNGVAVPLTDGASNDAFAMSIFVDGSDVYVAGWDGGVAEYWKNGVAIPLTSFNGSNGAEAWAIAVSEGDVYVAGWQYVTTQVNPTTTYTGPVAMLWKNGVPTALSDPLGVGITQSIFLSGGDIYIAGNSCPAAQPPPPPPGCNQATFWKNGTPTVLTDQTPTGATSVAVSGADVYVVGNQDLGQGAAIADFWKDGSLTLLTSGGPTAANAVVVSGSDVYVAGANIVGGIEMAGYWKNGAFTPVTNGTHNASGFAMTVVSH